MAPNNRLTLSQAQDLAHHYLGPDIPVAEAGNGLCMIVLLTGAVVGTGWREAFRKAGIKLPSRPEFAAIGPDIMLGRRLIATTPISNTWAKRIARALNNHHPDRRDI